MEEEVEDISSEVQCTESQKSMALSNVYSTDFTDNSSDKNNSSGKETYIIDRDDSDESEDSYQSQYQRSILNLNGKTYTQLADYHKMRSIQCDPINKISKTVCTSSSKLRIISQESFTQTSKTIFEIAQAEGGRLLTSANVKTLPTQTSLVSITEKKTVEYEIFSTSAINTINNKKCIDLEVNLIDNCNYAGYSDLEDKSSKVLEPETDNENVSEKNVSRELKRNSCDRIKNMSPYEIKNDIDQFSTSSSDMDEDSLMENKSKTVKYSKDDQDCNSDYTETPKSVENEVDDLYSKLSNRIGVFTLKQTQPENPLLGTLTPLTEESMLVKQSFVDMTPYLETVSCKEVKDKDINLLFTSDVGMKIRVLPQEESDQVKSNKDEFKLPPIQSNRLYNDTQHLNFLLSVNRNRPITSGQSYINENREQPGDGWESSTMDFAEGGSQFLHFLNQSNNSIRISNESFQLPPIIANDGFVSTVSAHNDYFEFTDTSKPDISIIETHDSININEKIKELKCSRKRTKCWVDNSSRSVSPTPTNATNMSSRDNSKLYEAAGKGCEALCTELLRKLKSPSWCEVLNTLEELPTVMESFWNLISEVRIADLLRQVTVHVESPRSQVAKSACTTLSCILKNTNFTRKPDFFEVMTALLVKTGSFSGPVRRAANMALDDVVCSVELTHVVTALCVHGVSHKSPLVRCAAARLLVVCCALAGGGRGLLRARPATAITARRHALRALAALLDDKAIDVRKYAERLYIMLRPLTSFEAYFLSDVSAEHASRQMKKYDRLLAFGAKDAR